MKGILFDMAMKKLAEKDLGPEERKMLTDMLHVSDIELDQMLAKVREAVKDEKTREEMKKAFEQQSMDSGQAAKSGFMGRVKGIFGK